MKKTMLKLAIAVSSLAAMSVSQAEAKTYNIYVQCSSNGQVREGTLTLPPKPSECHNTEVLTYDLKNGKRSRKPTGSKWYSSRATNQPLTISYRGKTYQSGEAVRYSYQGKDCQESDIASNFPTYVQETRTGWTVYLAMSEADGGGYGGNLSFDDGYGGLDVCTFLTQ